MSIQKPKNKTHKTLSWRLAPGRTLVIDHGIVIQNTGEFQTTIQVITPIAQPNKDQSSEPK